MKRCHRCGVEQSADPYQEVSFSAILRQYNPAPRKLVKLDRSAMEPLSESTLNIVPAENIKVVPLKELEVTLSKKETVPSSKKDEIGEARNEDIKVQEFNQHIQLPQQEQEQSKSLVAQGQSKQSEEPDMELANVTVIQVRPEGQHHKQERVYHTEEKNQQQLVAVDQNSPQPEPEEEQGGRLYLNDKVSVSRRTLQKHLLRSTSPNDLLERLLETRSYLRDQSDSVARRLSDYLTAYGLDQ